MKVHHVMSATLCTVAPDAKLPSVWKLLNEKHVNAIPVVDSKKKLLGILAREDILQRLFPELGEFIDDFFGEADFEKMEQKLNEQRDVVVKEVMNKRVIFTRRDTPIMRALSRMILRSVDQLPVLSDNDEVVGIVTKGDVFYALFRQQARREAGEVVHLGAAPAKKARTLVKNKKRKTKGN